MWQKRQKGQNARQAGQMMDNGQLGAKVSLSGVIEYRDKDGNIIKTVPFSGTAPLTQEEPQDGDSR